MKVRKILSIAVLSALLAACSSSGGSSGGGGGSSTVVPEKTIDINSDLGLTTLNGKTGDYDFSTLSNGKTELPATKGTLSGTLLVYQQPYSVITGEIWNHNSGTPGEVISASHSFGSATPWSAHQKRIGEDAWFTYKGVAYHGKEQGTLNYDMFFGKRQGGGSITGFSRTGTIDLLLAQLENDGVIRGWANLDKERGSGTGKYELSFFGPDADEIAGKVYDTGNGILGNNEIIFAGTAEQKYVPPKLP